jgi:hypothetical protein
LLCVIGFWLFCKQSGIHANIGRQLKSSGKILWCIVSSKCFTLCVKARRNCKLSIKLLCSLVIHFST